MTDLRYAAAPIAQVEVRDPSGTDGTWTMSGYAAVFGETTTLYDGKFEKVTESIHPSAFDRVLREQELNTASGAVHFNLGHDMNRAVAATNVPWGNPGSLQLQTDARGLRFTAKVSREDPDGQALAAKMRAGVIRQASFAFTVASSQHDSSESEEGRTTEHRTILELAHLYDVCATTQGAYSQTVSGLQTYAKALQLPTNPRPRNTPKAKVKKGTPAMSPRIVPDDPELVLARSRATLAELQGGRGVTVREPDAYRPGDRNSFLRDLWRSNLSNDDAATARLQRHHEFELDRRTKHLPATEKRAVTSATVGGIIPPQYLVDTYAKAARNGRVYADQVSGLPMPPVGMTFTVPRLTVGLGAGIQATENTAVTTSDPAEVDLSVPVRTIAGSSPVSFQALDRQELTEEIVIEDITARYNATLDTQCINGSGSSGQILGVLGTSGIATSTATTASGPVVISKIFDCCSQIETSLAGLGITANKIVMHPRRWRWLCALSDTTNVRPYVLPDTDEPDTSSSSPGYVGKLANLSVYIDANIPVTLGGGTEDRIIVFVSSLVNLWEIAGAPMTFRFDQQTGTSLQSQLVVESQAAFTAGRYPLGSGVVSGAALVTPVYP